MFQLFQDNAYGSVGSGVNQNQHFSSVAYSSNGLWILASAKTSARVSFLFPDHVGHRLWHSCNFKMKRVNCLSGLCI